MAQADDNTTIGSVADDNATMTKEEIRKWLEEVGEGAEKLINPGVLRVPASKLKEWIQREDIYITFRGVVLKLSPVSSFLAHERANMVPHPDVPMKMNEDKGREEPDPFDPVYLTAFAEAEKEKSSIIMNTYFAMGTQLVWKPEDVADIDSDEWTKPLQDPAVLGKYTLTIEPPGTMARYIQWLKYIAMTDKDYVGIPTHIQILGGGVRAEVVQNALVNFPGTEERGTNRGVATTPRKQRNRTRSPRS